MRGLMWIPVVILTVSVLSAQEDAKTLPKKPPTPKEKAQELVEKAVDAVSGAQPQAQVAGLLHLAELYQEFDKKRSEEIFRQAFAAAASLPQEGGRNHRDHMMSSVASVAAEYNVDLAMDFLTQLGPPQSGRRDGRVAILNQVAQQLIKQKRADRAAELIISLGSEGEFAFGAAGLVMKSLPENDPLGSQLFSSATTAYSARPTGPFPLFVSQHWRKVPQALAESAASAILNAVLDPKKKNDESYTQTVSSSKGSVSFTSAQNAELFDVLHVVKAVNPKRAEELLESRIELRQAISQFPEGRESMKPENGSGISTSTRAGSSQRDPRQEAQMHLQGLSNSKMQEAMSVAKESPDKAIALIKQIPLDETRASALSMLANQAAAKDPSTAKALLTQCMNLLDDLKKPENTIDAYLNVAEAAHKIQDEERARLALDRALTGATELSKLDSDAEAPNRAPREYWPSTQSYRRIIYRATSMYGVDAEYVLPKITDPELHILASIEMARSLLKKPGRSGDTMTDRSKR